MHVYSHVFIGNYPHPPHSQLKIHLWSDTVTIASCRYEFKWKSTTDIHMEISFRGDFLLRILYMVTRMSGLALRVFKVARACVRMHAGLWHLGICSCIRGPNLSTLKSIMKALDTFSLLSPKSILFVGVTFIAELLVLWFVFFHLSRLPYFCTLVYDLCAL